MNAELQDLQKKVKTVYDKLYVAQVKTEGERKELERELDELKRNLEMNDLTEYTQQQQQQQQQSEQWTGYPDITDPLFNAKLYNKKEFNQYIVHQKDILAEKVSQSSIGFVKTNMQKLIGNYMSANTPYNGILLWHGVGVGKTCAALTAAENYRQTGLNSKIIILAPKALAQEWKDKMFDPNLEYDYENSTPVNRVMSCTSPQFKNEMGLVDNMSQKQVKKRVERVIKKYYTITGYRKFANDVKTLIDNELRSRTDKEYLKIRLFKNIFSNRIFILDEVHFSRSDANEKEYKLISEIIGLIARYGENNKFILASATPMYNSADEIIELLNWLLLNDKRGPILKSKVFRADGYTLTEEGASILTEKSRGYISYLRGENPSSFPLKLYPQINIPGSCRSYIPNPDKTFVAGRIVPLDANLKIKNLSFIQHVMSAFQYRLYEPYQRATDDASMLSDNFNIQSTQASNVVFPSGHIGIEGFDKTFIEKPGGHYIYNVANPGCVALKEAADSPQAKKDAELLSMRFLVRENLANYSCKFAGIFDIITNAEGIIFIFSKYIKPGILSFALMLEYNGYMRYTDKISTEGNILLPHPECHIEPRCYCGKRKSDGHSVSHKFVQGRYIYLDGEVSKDKMSHLIKEVRGKGPSKNENLDGSHIKFILGSAVVEQGVDFFNIREVHIIDPWHHMNRIEQVVGRAIRRNSHEKLEEPKHNVSVYLHCATIPNQREYIESSDERTYRNAYNKAIKIAHVSRILKQGALDCLINKNANQLTVERFNYIMRPIITSQNVAIDNKYLGDVDGDAICDYTKCIYTCSNEDVIKQYSTNINTDTYNETLMMEDLSDVRRFLIQLFVLKNAYTLTEIVKEMKRFKPYIGRNVLLVGLDHSILNKESIYDQYSREGYIIYRYPYYIYQPFELKTESASIFARSIPLAIQGNASPIQKRVVVDEHIESHAAVAVDTHLLFVRELRDHLEQIRRTYLAIATEKDKHGKRDIIKGIYGDLMFPENIELRDFFIGNCLDQPCVLFELLEQYYSFGVLDRLSFEQKYIVLNGVLCRFIENNCLFSPDDILEKYVFRFFGNKGPTDHRHTIFTRNILEKNTNKEIQQLIVAATTGLKKNNTQPILFRLFRWKTANPVKEDIWTIGDSVFFYYNAETRVFDEYISSVALQTYDYFYASPAYDIDTKKVYGYVMDKGTGDKLKAASAGGKVPDVNFYLAFKIGHSVKRNMDDTEQTKSKIFGSVCGTGNAVGGQTVDKEGLINVIHYITDPPADETNESYKQKRNYDRFLEEKIKNNIARVGIYQQTIKGGSLCEIIEFTLRHRQYVEPSGDWFLNKEEYAFLISKMNTAKNMKLRKK
jgi:hypothetical protein